MHNMFSHVHFRAQPTTAVISPHLSASGSGSAFNSHAVLECVATVIKMFEIQRLLIGDKSEAFNAKYWRTFFDVERGGQGRVGKHGFDLKIGGTKRKAVVV